jgi:tetrahydromethanopterin:alpha-L-glutamate ligase
MDGRSAVDCLNYLEALSLIRGGRKKEKYYGVNYNPMRFGIIVSDPDDWTARSLRSSFMHMGSEVDFLNFSDLYASIGVTGTELHLTSKGKALIELDGLVVRDLGRGKAHDVAFRFEVLRALEDLGIPVVNPPEAIARAANKFATSAALHHAGVPTPWTAVTSSMSEATKFLNQCCKAVSKPLFGYKGQGIVLLTQNDATALQSILDAQGMIYLQEFISLERPRDIRAFVVAGEVVGAIYRVAPPGAWITNLARGGKAIPCPVTEEIRELAVNASRAVGTVYCGVDLLETKNGLKVIEVNGTPSGKGIYEALGVDVTKAIACYILDK